MPGFKGKRKRGLTLTLYKKTFRYRLPVSPPRKRTKTSSSTPNLKSPSTRTPSLLKKSLSIDCITAGLILQNSTKFKKSVPIKSILLACDLSFLLRVYCCIFPFKYRQMSTSLFDLIKFLKLLTG